MFAIVRTGGKQYRVAAGDKIVVEKMDGEAQSVDGLSVSARIIAQARGEKVIVFKKRRRHNYRRRNGHRQYHTILEILSVGGEHKQAQQAEAPVAAQAPAVADA